MSAISDQSPKSRRRRRSSLQPLIIENNPEEDVEVSREESSSKGGASFDEEEPTGTVQLPDNLNDLLESEGMQTKNTSVVSANEDVTEALETNLESLIDKIGVSYLQADRDEEEDESSRASTSSRASSGLNVSKSSVSSKALSDNSMGALIGAPLETKANGDDAPAASPVSFDFDRRREVSEYSTFCIDFGGVYSIFPIDFGTVSVYE